MKMIKGIIAVILMFGSQAMANESWDMIEEVFKREAIRDPQVLIKIPAQNYNCELLTKNASQSVTTAVANKSFGKIKEFRIKNSEGILFRGEMIADNTRDNNNLFDGLVGEYQTAGEELDGVLRGVFEGKNYLGFVVRLETQGVFGFAKYYLACEKASQ
jgi:hypothetical protein